MPSKKFIKKPVVIEAWYLDVNDYDDELKAAEWCDGRVVMEHFAAFFPGAGIIAIDTLEGTMYAQHGDWIIKGVEGEFYPCKPSVFDATYEVVDDE